MDRGARWNTAHGVTVMTEHAHTHCLKAGFPKWPELCSTYSPVTREPATCRLLVLGLLFTWDMLVKPASVWETLPRQAAPWQRWALSFLPRSPSPFVSQEWKPTGWAPLWGTGAPGPSGSVPASGQTPSLPLLAQPSHGPPDPPPLCSQLLESCTPSQACLCTSGSFWAKVKGRWEGQMSQMKPWQDGETIAQARDCYWREEYKLIPSMPIIRKCLWCGLIKIQQYWFQITIFIVICNIQFLRFPADKQITIIHDIEHFEEWLSFWGSVWVCQIVLTPSCTCKPHSKHRVSSSPHPQDKTS